MEPIQFAVNFKYSKSFIPPRCRKPRYKEEMASCDIFLKAATPEEAPVVMQHPHGFYPMEYMKEYRWYQNRLYTRVLWSEKLCNAKGWYPMEELEKCFEKKHTWGCLSTWPGSGFDVHTYDGCAESIRDRYADILIILNEDGEKEVWSEEGEPRYEVVTFGLGHNHAGTDYFITNCYNSNIRKDRYFTALQHEAAVDCALQVAKARGDTNSFDMIRNGPKIEVFDPSAVRCEPNKEAGDGDPFMNRLEAIAQLGDSTMESAAFVMALTAKETR